MLGAVSLAVSVLGINALTDFVAAVYGYLPNVLARGVRVLGVGELLFSGRRKGINPAPPVDIARTIEDALSVAPLDFVHVHEPWAPSAGSVALRHSRALNVGSFHQPAERVLSTQVARRFVEMFG